MARPLLLRFVGGNLFFCQSAYFFGTHAVAVDADIVDKTIPESTVVLGVVADSHLPVVEANAAGSGLDAIDPSVDVEIYVAR